MLKFAITCALVSTLTIGCLEGPTGPKGETGANGLNGANGVKGIDGLDGQNGQNAKFTDIGGALKSLPFNSANDYWSIFVSIAPKSIVSVIVRPNALSPWKAPDWAYTENNNQLLTLGTVQIFKDAVVTEDWEYRITIIQSP